MCLKKGNTMHILKSVFYGFVCIGVSCFYSQSLLSTTVNDSNDPAIQTALMLSQQQARQDEFKEKILKKLRERINAGLSNDMALQAALLESFAELKKEHDIVEPGSPEAQALEYGIMLSQQQNEQDNTIKQNDREHEINGNLNEEEALQIALAESRDSFEPGA